MKESERTCIHAVSNIECACVVLFPFRALDYTCRINAILWSMKQNCTLDELTHTNGVSQCGAFKLSGRARTWPGVSCRARDHSYCDYVRGGGCESQKLAIIEPYANNDDDKMCVLCYEQCFRLKGERERVNGGKATLRMS